MKTLSVFDIVCDDKNHLSECKSMKNRLKNARKIGGDSYVTFCDGSKYAGEVVRGECHGVGKLKFSNGEIYSGFWQHNTKTG